jgi:hypothetical protein
VLIVFIRKLLSQGLHNIIPAFIRNSHMQRKDI